MSRALTISASRVQPRYSAATCKQQIGIQYKNLQMFLLKSLIGGLATPSFSDKQSSCPKSLPLFYGKTAVFSPTLANLYYERLWTQHGGDVLRISGFFDIEGSTTRYENDIGDNRGHDWFDRIWHQVYRNADYVFVDAETWADASLTDARIVSFDPSWITSCIRAKRILPGSQHAFWPTRINPNYVPSKRHLRAKRTPLSGRLGLTATETGEIQLCLHSVRENMKLLESPEKDSNISMDNNQLFGDCGVIGGSPKQPACSASSPNYSRPTKRRRRQKHRIEKWSPSTLVYQDRTKTVAQDRDRVDTPDVSDFSLRKPTYSPRDVSEAEGENETTLVEGRIHMSKRRQEGSGDTADVKEVDTIYVASTSPVAIEAANLANTKLQAPLRDRDCEQFEVEISSVEDSFVYLSRIPS
ncbi:hypothetical protein POJ06DRAFT_249886 [Lipomyces tetrasporus]|uniref:Uncharacterized protein n=1 Tax=Lipomyces tetrasporus TaxID=54092 RepID=A0AAD7VSE0_9ASCO|nr:uncharacterized protein POJ06DRAFT_249886 [Lipomyces tetrasporus]KAJ8100927.1 hypothetical protein POJ06DRAFT_249886 [Lipomyces tetrasporus]